MNVTGPGQSVQLLLKVIEILDQEKIDYAVIGAMAVALHGIVRASVDVDCVISLNNRLKPQELVQKLKKLELSVEYREADLFDPLLGLIAVKDSFHNLVDLLLGIKGLGPGIYNRAEKVIIFDKELNIVGLEDLIAMKLFAGSFRDIEDAKGMLDVSREKLDEKLLLKLCEGYGDETTERLNDILM